LAEDYLVLLVVIHGPQDNPEHETKYHHLSQLGSKWLHYLFDFFQPRRHSHSVKEIFEMWAELWWKLNFLDFAFYVAVLFQMIASQTPF
jgi:hypothetical protein